MERDWNLELFSQWSTLLDLLSHMTVDLMSSNLQLQLNGLRRHLECQRARLHWLTSPQSGLWVWLIHDSKVTVLVPPVWRPGEPTRESRGGIAETKALIGSQISVKR